MILDNIFPISGGITTSTIYGLITTHGVFQIMVYAAIGAIIGFLVGKICHKICHKIDKQLKKFRNRNRDKIEYRDGDN